MARRANAEGTLGSRRTVFRPRGRWMLRFHLSALLPLRLISDRVVITSSGEPNHAAHASIERIEGAVLRSRTSGLPAFQARFELSGHAYQHC